MKLLLASLATVIGFVGYAPYIRDTLRGTTKPHVFSWVAWGSIETIAFFAQLSAGGGAGAWFTGASALIVFFIAALAIRQKDTQIKPIDYVALSGSAIGIALWRITSNPLLAVISVGIADAAAFAPTFRKAYRKPNEETLFEYAASVLKWTLAIPALTSVNLTTVLYPASLVLTNSIFVLLVLWRRSSTKVST